MEHMVDPVNIIVVGGYRVGKTSLLNRLAGGDWNGLNPDYQPSSSINTVTLGLSLVDGLTLDVRIIDIPAALIGDSTHPKLSNTFNASHPLASLFRCVRIDGAFVLIDGTQKKSLQESDQWMELLSKIGPKPLMKMVLVHKSDLQVKDRVLTAKHLDKYMSNTDLVDWAYTVSHPQLGDIDPARGNVHKQKSPEELLLRMVLLVLAARQSNMYRLLVVPHIFSLKECRTYEISEMHHIWTNDD